MTCEGIPFLLYNSHASVPKNQHELRSAIMEALLPAVLTCGCSIGMHDVNSPHGIQMQHFQTCQVYHVGKVLYQPSFHI